MTRLLAFLFAVLAAAPVFAQGANQSQLRLVIVDETGAGIPAATIVVTPAGGGTPITLTSDERGLASVPSLPAGTVQLHVEFPGFTPADQQVSLKRGANNQTITLKIAGLEEQVVVSDTSSVEDRSGNAQTTTLEQSEIDQLPDDPDELQAALEQMTGGQGAIFQVNGFRGGRLPSRDEIRQIRFRTNSFAADNHEAGRVFVQIITKPNVRTWSGNANIGARNSALNARNAFSDVKTPERIGRFNMGVRGPLVAGKTAIRVNVDGNRSTTSDTIVAVNEDGSRLGTEFSRPSNRTNVNLEVEHALTGKQTLRLEYRNGSSSDQNLGVGGFNLLERAYSRTTESRQVRAQVQGLVGKTTLNELRVEFNDNSNQSASASSAPTIIVLDAFSRGGAGVSNHGNTRSYSVADDLDFNWGRKHAMRAGFLLEGGRYDTFDARNVNGTFTFSSLDAFLAGVPSQYTQRIINVNDTTYGNYQLGMYWQDDIRVNKAFSYSVGLREEMQAHITDKINVMPRLGFTANPFGAKTTFRGGYGIFYDWYDTSMYAQTLLVNGVDQKDLLIFNPGYPDAFSGAHQVVLPGGRVQASPDLTLPYLHEASLGVERQITKSLTLQASYQMLRGRNLLRSINANAPDANGVRPEPTVGTVTQYESTGRSSTDRVTLGAQFRIPSRNMFMFANYTLGQALNYADSALQLPADSNNPNAEWGPSSQDVRNRFNATINMPMPGQIRVNLRANAQSAAPYNITTGVDTNHDGVFTDRPDGVGRNSARGSGMWNLDMRVGRSFSFGGVRSGDGGAGGRGGNGGNGGRGGFGGPGQVNQQVGIGGPGGGPRGGGGRGNGGDGQFGGGNNGSQRFSLELFAQATNVLNHTNYMNYSGNLLSPFFGKPTAAAQARRLELGMQFRF